MVSPPYDPLGRRLVFTAKALRDAFEETLHAEGGSLGTWIVLACLTDEGVMNQTALAGHMRVEGATITHHIDRLEHLGLVRRQGDPADRRVRRVELTATGKRLQSRLLTAVKKLEAEVLSGLSDRQRDELRKTLDTIQGNLVALRASRASRSRAAG